MTLYENVVIGNFLYTLGLNIGLEKSSAPAIINLLQQTPSDKILGDLLLEFTGVVRLIEFKNKKTSLTKEKNKLEQINISLGDNKDMLRISRQIHWYIETEPTEDKIYNRIVPYLDAFNPSIYGEYTIESYINKMVDEIINPDINFDIQGVKNYLQLIRNAQGNKDVGTGGLIIVANKKEIRYVQISDFMQLRLQHKEFVKEIQNVYESVMKLEKEKDKKKEHNLTLGRSI